jgi:hypothetical protein
MGKICVIRTVISPANAGLAGSCGYIELKHALAKESFWISSGFQRYRTTAFTPQCGMLAALRPNTSCRDLVQCFSRGTNETTRA